jgi:hypothetical protein
VTGGRHDGGGRVARPGSGDLVGSLTAKWLREREQREAAREQQLGVGDREHLDTPPAAAVPELTDTAARQALDELHRDVKAYEDQPRWRPS